MTLLKTILFVTTVFGGAAFSSAASTSELEQGERKTSSNHSSSKQSQQRIDNLDEQIRTSRAEYLNNERMADITEAYNQQIAQLVQAQQDELADLQRQLESIEETDQSVLPMLNRMVETLGRFIEADLPFLQRERSKRLAKLNTLLMRADVSVAEKYRQILEAYMIEVQYGRTFESYSGVLQQEQTQRQVNFLRLGRTALYYQTLNGEESGMWQPAQERWQVLTETQNLTIRKAIHIAQQLKVPELVDLPLPQLESRS